MNRLRRVLRDTLRDQGLHVDIVRPLLTDSPIREGGISLVGPNPPLHFRHDGCSSSPDFWWWDACIVHDYEYALLRVEYAKLGALRHELRFNSANLAVDEYMSIKVEVERLTRLIRHMRLTADRNLRENIRRCSQGRMWCYAWAWYCSRWYYRGVRLFGGRAVRGPGHSQN